LPKVPSKRAFSERLATVETDVMTNRVYDLGFEAGRLAFAEELRARLENTEEALALRDILEILDAELAHRDAAAHRSLLPAPLKKVPVGNVVVFPVRSEPET
jgi:hypothetical protein